MADGSGRNGMEEIERLLSIEELTRLLAVLEGRTDMLVSLQNPAMELLWASPTAAAATFQRTEADYLGQAATAFVHPDDVPAYERSFAAARTGVTARWEGRVSTAAGGWVRVRSVMWRTQGGTIIIAILVIVDAG